MVVEWRWCEGLVVIGIGFVFDCFGCIGFGWLGWGFVGYGGFFVDFG